MKTINLRTTTAALAAGALAIAGCTVEDEPDVVDGSPDVVQDDQTEDGGDTDVDVDADADAGADADGDADVDAGDDMDDAGDE